MQDYKYENQIDRFPVAMAYVPWQKFDKMIDDLEKAYHIGTIFPELVSPYMPGQSMEEIEFIRNSNTIGKGCNK